MLTKAIRWLVRVVREDNKNFGNPFKHVVNEYLHGFVDIIENVLENTMYQFTQRELEDYVVAYDAWLDVFPDSWDGDCYPNVLDVFIPFAQDVRRLLAIGRITTSLEVANLVRDGRLSIIDVETSLEEFKYFVDDAVNEHEAALNELDNADCQESNPDDDFESIK